MFPQGSVHRADRARSSPFATLVPAPSRRNDRSRAATMDISEVSVAMLATPVFWLALMQIILINIMLSGDNAVVIALASRSLPPAQQKRAIILGSVGAILLRVILTFFAVLLLELPYLKLAGGLAL